MKFCQVAATLKDLLRPPLWFAALGPRPCLQQRTRQGTALCREVHLIKGHLGEFIEASVTSKGQSGFFFKWIYHDPSILVHLYRLFDYIRIPCIYIYIYIYSYIYLLKYAAIM